MTQGARYRPTGGRVAAMAVLTVIALGAFVVLADVRLNEDDWWFEGVSDSASRATMTGALVLLEVVCLVGVLILLLVGPRQPTEPEPWLADDWTTQSATTPPEQLTGFRIQIGCPGCGTVFEKASTSIDEPHEQSFQCPNCGRSGRLRTGVHKSVAIESRSCVSCGNAFQSYRPDAECPHCHAKQS